MRKIIIDNILNGFLPVAEKFKQDFRSQLRKLTSKVGMSGFNNCNLKPVPHLIFGNINSKSKN